MKLTALAILAFAALANAQGESDIPACAQTCIDDSVKKTTNCATDDLACICQNQNAIKTDATSCVLKACGQDVAINKVLPAMQELCSKVEKGGSESSTAKDSSNLASSTSAPTGQLTRTAQSTNTASASASAAAGAAVFAPIGGPALLALGALFL